MEETPKRLLSQPTTGVIYREGKETGVNEIDTASGTKYTRDRLYKTKCLLDCWFSRLHEASYKCSDLDRCTERPVSRHAKLSSC